MSLAEAHTTQHFPLKVRYCSQLWKSGKEAFGKAPREMSWVSLTNWVVVFFFLIQKGRVSSERGETKDIGRGLAGVGVGVGVGSGQGSLIWLLGNFRDRLEVSDTVPTFQLGPRRGQDQWNFRAKNRSPRTPRFEEYPLWENSASETYFTSLSHLSPQSFIWGQILMDLTADQDSSILWSTHQNAIPFYG